MATSDALIRSILGPIRPSIRPLVLAVDLTGDLLFTQRLSMDDIRVTKHVYPDVARQLNKNTNAVSRQIERLSHVCWDSLVAKQLVPLYLGQTPPQAPPPHALLVYLAVYSHLGLPFSTAIEQYPHLLIQPQLEEKPLPAMSNPVPAELLRGQPLLVTQIMVFPDSPGRLSFPVCPHCRITLEREYLHFCDRCGQCLDWSNFKNAQIIYPRYN